MTDREKFIELLLEIDSVCDASDCCECCEEGYYTYRAADHLIANGVTVRQPPRPLEEWGEDYGDVLWWTFPIEEPPYVGSPLDEKWPGYHTHWTPIIVPDLPKED